MDRQVFQERFRAAAAAARDFARKFVMEPLPEAMLFRVRLNSSYDGNPLVEDEQVYPEESSEEHARELLACTEDVVLATLWRGGAVPEWVDLSVIGETRGATLVELLVCGRFTAREDRLYHAAEGRPPFHTVGPSLPVHYTEGQRFSIYHRSECWNLEDVELLRQHHHKVWSLELIGEDFEDKVLGALPALPALEILELRGSRMEGSALETLGRFPRLRVLRLELSEGRPFTVPRLPLLPNLEALNIRGLPGSPWGFSHLGPSVPALSWLSLESAGDLVLDGECPGCGWCLDLTGRRAVGGASLPSRLNMAGLHLSGASGTQVEDLLANVDTAQSLSLRETPVEERTAIRLAARLGLERLDLRNTGLDDDAIGRISEACPKTKIFPSSKRGARNEG